MVVTVSVVLVMMWKFLIRVIRRRMSYSSRWSRIWWGFLRPLASVITRWVAGGTWWVTRSWVSVPRWIWSWGRAWATWASRRWWRWRWWRVRTSLLLFLLFHLLFAILRWRFTSRWWFWIRFWRRGLGWFIPFLVLVRHY